MVEPTIHQLFNLTGRVVLVTGATGHLGGALAQALAEAGASVVVSSRELDRGKHMAASLPSPGGAVHHAVSLDHLDTASIDRGFDEAVRAAGRLDILVNNGHSRDSHDLTNVGSADFNRVLQNVTGYFLLARRMPQHAVQRGTSASIIMLGSMYGIVGSYPDVYEDVGPASGVHYHALKGGVVQMTRHLAVYWARDGVRVNCLSPGPFPAPGAPARVVERLSLKSPLQRMGSPSELKGAILLLASDAGSYVTGHNLVVDGGWTAW